MSSGQTNKPRDVTRRSRAAFTLLEVMLAVLILGMVAVSIYRFVLTITSAVQISTEHLRENELMEAFARYLRLQMQSLPTTQLGAISGQAHRFNDVPSDELRWISGPGSGLLTRNATGEWNVTLTTKQLKGKDNYELGFRRESVDGKVTADWLPLLSGVTGFEVRYYDQRAAAWMEKWTDIAARPALVRVKLWRAPSLDAYEVVLPLPSAIANAQPPNFANPQANPPGNPQANPQGVPGNAVPAGGIPNPNGGPPIHQSLDSLMPPPRR